MAGLSAWANSREEQTATGLPRATVDPWLCQNVLNKQRNLAMLQRLEDELETFVKDPKLMQLEAVPPGKSAFQRKVVNLVALHYGLLNKLGPMSSLILIKSPETRIPPYRISATNQHPEQPSRHLAPPETSTPEDHVDNTGIQLVRRLSPPIACSQQVGAPVDIPSEPLDSALEPLPQASALAKRPQGAHGLSVPLASASGAIPPAAIRNITDEEYAAARARIFHGENGLSSCAFTVPEAAAVELPLEESDALRRNTTNAGPTVRLAAGPQEGTRGFARGRGRQVHPGIPGLSLLGKGAAMADPEVGRSQDMYDPDFDRSYQRWMAPPAPNFNVAAATAAAAAAAAAAAMQNHQLLMHNLAVQNGDFGHYGFNRMPNNLDYRNYPTPMGNGIPIHRPLRAPGPGPRGGTDWGTQRPEPPIHREQKNMRVVDAREDVAGHLRANLDDMSAFPPLTGPPTSEKSQPS